MTQQVQKAPATNSTKMLLAMTGIGVMCALMIVLTFQGTLPIIKENRAEALQKAIFKVVPGTENTEAYVLTGDNGFKEKTDADAEDAETVYAGYDAAGQLTGIAIEASGQGYADIITILYGYDPENREVIGFHVLASKETPGLGDKIEKDENFLANFDGLKVDLAENGKSVENKIVPVKSGEKSNPWEVEGITGATISSRAIGNILGASTEKWAPLINDNLDVLRKSENNQEN